LAEANANRENKKARIVRALRAGLSPVGLIETTWAFCTVLFLSCG